MTTNETRTKEGIEGQDDGRPVCETCGRPIQCIRSNGPEDQRAGCGHQISDLTVAEAAA